ncbi:uncharacterized protein V1513DRAFT_427841 [Lipomyces chichibuensis]|uniref:uncharacterized protein n=1 Tax=Lipomyces chichibuensis TaxID=1546026 RepID=UPI003343AD94
MTELSPDNIAMSSKVPDESFLYERPGGSPRLQVVIECGVSENYKALCRDKDLWIQHLEAPQFKTARTALENIEKNRPP